MHSTIDAPSPGQMKTVAPPAQQPTLNFNRAAAFSQLEGIRLPHKELAVLRAVCEFIWPPGQANPRPDWTAPIPDVAARAGLSRTTAQTQLKRLRSRGLVTFAPTGDASGSTFAVSWRLVFADRPPPLPPPPKPKALRIDPSETGGPPDFGGPPIETGGPPEAESEGLEGWLDPPPRDSPDPTLTLILAELRLLRVAFESIASTLRAALSWWRRFDPSGGPPISGGPPEASAPLDSRVLFSSSKEERKETLSNRVVSEAPARAGALEASGGTGGAGVAVRRCTLGKIDPVRIFRDAAYVREFFATLERDGVSKPSERELVLGWLLTVRDKVKGREVRDFASYIVATMYRDPIAEWRSKVEERVLPEAQRCLGDIEGGTVPAQAGTSRPGLVVGHVGR